MDIADLRLFETVARLGSMNRAAASLHTVQSNVTARIRALETHLGIPLFERRSNGVVPTPAGRRLLPYARRMTSLMIDAERAARDDGTPSGTLILGSLETTAALRLAPILTEFAAAYPSVDLALRTGTTAELVQMVLERALDGAFVCGPVKHPALEETAMFREELCVLAAPRIHSLREATASGQARIVVLRRGCSYRRRLEEVLARRGIPAPRVMEFGTLEAIFAAVSAGLGITLLPHSLVGPVCAAGRVSLHRLPPAESLVETVFLRNRDAFPLSALAELLARTQRAFHGATHQKPARRLSLAL